LRYSTWKIFTNNDMIGIIINLNLISFLADQPGFMQ